LNIREFRRLPDLSKRRMDHGCSMIQRNNRKQLMVFGGRIDCFNITPKVEFYDWSQQPNSAWVQERSIPYFVNAIVASVFRVYNETMCDLVTISSTSFWWTYVKSLHLKIAFFTFLNVPAFKYSCHQRWLLKLTPDVHFWSLSNHDNLPR